MRFLTTLISIGRKNWKDFEKFLNLTPENGIHTKSRVQKQSWQTKYFTNSKLLSRNVFKNRHTLKALSKFINIHKLPLIFIKWGFNKVPWFSDCTREREFRERPFDWYVLRNFPKFSRNFVFKLTLSAPWKSRIFCKNVKIHSWKFAPE